MTPLTLMYAGILGLILFILTFRVVLAVRVKGGVNLGDGDNPGFNAVIRGHGNFIEYVPIALILMGLLEANAAASATTLHAMGIALVISRVIHPLGLNPEKAITPARLLGAATTFIVIGVASLAAIRAAFSA